MATDDELELARAIDQAEQEVARLEASLATARGANAAREQRLVAEATRERDAASARVQALRARLRTTGRNARRLEWGGRPSVWTLNGPERMGARIFAAVVFAVTFPALKDKVSGFAALGVMALAWLAANVAGSRYESGAEGAAGAGARRRASALPRAGAGAQGPTAAEPGAPASPGLDAHGDDAPGSDDR